MAEQNKTINLANFLVASDVCFPQERLARVCFKLRFSAVRSVLTFLVLTLLAHYLKDDKMEITVLRNKNGYPIVTFF